MQRLNVNTNLIDISRMVNSCMGSVKQLMKKRIQSAWCFLFMQWKLSWSCFQIHLVWQHNLQGMFLRFWASIFLSTSHTYANWPVWLSICFLCSIVLLLSRWSFFLQSGIMIMCIMSVCREWVMVWMLHGKTSLEHWWYECVISLDLFMISRRFPFLWFQLKICLTLLSSLCNGGIVVFCY